jgi:hypothetical protein
MSRLVSYLSNAVHDTATPVVESYPLSELCPSATMHTYPPSPQPATSPSEDYQVSRPAATAQTYPPQYGEDFPMDASSSHSPWQSVCRMRDDGEQWVSCRIFFFFSELTNHQPNKVQLKEVNESVKLHADMRGLHATNHDLLLRKCHEQV